MGSGHQVDETKEQLFSLLLVYFFFVLLWWKYYLPNSNFILIITASKNPGLEFSMSWTWCVSEKSSVGSPDHYSAMSSGVLLGLLVSSRLTFPCPFCEAAFTSKTQLEKHRIWNHMDRPLPAPKPGPVSRPVTVSRPVGVSKPIGVSKPVTISKPIGISKPVTVVAGPQATQPQQQGAHSPHSGYP